VQPLTEDDLQAVQNTRSVGDTAGAIFTTTRFEYDDEQAFASVFGIPTGKGQDIAKSGLAMTLGDGRDLRNSDTSSVVIGSTIADGTFDEEVGLNDRITINEEDFRVVGILETVGDPGVDASAIMPYETSLETLNASEDEYDYVFARIQPGFSADQVKQDMQKNLRDSRDVEEGEEDFQISTSEDLLQTFNQVFSVVQWVVVGIASISLFVGGVGIMNTMYTSVAERTREIGVMKAVGATDRQVLTLFLMESGMIGLMGGLLGVAVGGGLSIMTSYLASTLSSFPIQAGLDPTLIIGSLAFSFTVGTISGLFPAKQAARLQPADALSYD